MILSAALIKNLTGNDTIPARFLHENTFEYLPQFKIFVNTNHLPLVTDASVFLSGRIRVIPFERHFSEEEQDKDLKRTFSKKDNLSAILNWCIEGFRLYQKEGLEIPKSIKDATSDYMKDSDKIYRFIEEIMEKGCDYEVKTSDAFQEFKSWCEKNNFGATSIKTFSQDLKSHGITIAQNRRPKTGGNPASMIEGMKLREIIPKGFIQVGESEIEF